MKVLVITAKDKICPMEETECNPDYCPYAKGHFDRINDAMYELLQSENMFSRDIILECAGKHQVCPFEMSLDMSMYADAIIARYIFFAISPLGTLVSSFGLIYSLHRTTAVSYASCSPSI